MRVLKVHRERNKYDGGKSVSQIVYSKWCEGAKALIDEGEDAGDHRLAMKNI